ncbi:MAG TPA: cation:dicarboxylase symporter family transporter, partial [Gemmatimonadales bacterium]|nr:cation:dicarboxylase symporter family transporter [Gemmatimonadales bacterium]
MWRFLRGISLTKWILIAMVIGALVGWLWPGTGAALKPLSTIFLRMIKVIIVPLLFGTLVVGIAGHGDDLKRVGRLAWKSILYFEVMTTIALFIGLAAVHLTKPGVGVQLAAPADAAQQI